MNNFVIKALDRISMKGLDMSCWTLDNIFSTALVTKSVENNEPLTYRNTEGFLDIKPKEFVDKLDSELKLVLASNKESRLYIAKDTIFNIAAEHGEENKYDLFMLTNNEEIVKTFDALCKKHISETKVSTIYALSSGSEGFYLSSLGQVDSPLIRENYSDDVLVGYDFVIDDIQAEDPHGRLVIINGPPGTGKTYLIKGLASELCDSTIIIIPPRLIAEIDGPSLIPTFISHRRRKDSSIVLIIEDADSCLAPRASDNISSISSLLNCADGILGSMLDIKIIATTNQARMEFDGALMRPGRLSRHIEVDELSIGKSNEVYCRLTGKKDAEKYARKTILASV